MVRIGVLQYGDWVTRGFYANERHGSDGLVLRATGPSFASTNTTGKFTLAVFDNGDDRVFPVGVTCGTTGKPPCFYSTAPVIEVDETAKTATLVFNPTAPSYSFLEATTPLSNGNLEFYESAGGPNTVGDIYAITQGTASTTVWRMMVALNVYRGQRIPSLYSDVQW